ncbi:hypothetical protein BP6252_08751 [Coleophoma cylindrospora]|uniref:Carrier domain-containing protein n=1 Tax=Coleophoma cylindrospora TaxID=1849047 RepID=A0A3D8R705_9HELO|nr:hypothetical protein BP6252_08751 [Coleophoma cylindrospora]
MAEHGDIAIIGMACRVAGANSPSELWDLLESSRDVQTEITRFNINTFYHPDGGPRKGLTNVKRAYMLDNNSIDRFDHAFFQVTPVEASAIDPQQRMLLEIAYEVIESAGIPLDEFMGTNTAVFAGMDSCDYHNIMTRDIEATPRYLATGTATCMAANRISYFFNLSGASMAVDTACSSTMTAVHQAVRALQQGDSSMAIVCGAKLILTPDMYIPSSELGFLSPRGRCHSFDASGDGYGRAEGVLSLLLKPLADAIRDNDPVRAIVKGVALNQDGRTQGITLPSSEAQKNNMNKLYGNLSLDPASIQYLEAHGTGTAAGDPLEFSAINEVFSRTDRPENLIVGSVKSNIGHLEACAALAGIIKTVGCLERRRIPSQMHLTMPNPRIDFTKVRIPMATLEWPRTEGPRRAGVNTFGAGGTNGHAVLEGYDRDLESPSSVAKSRRFLYRLSAADEDSLLRLCGLYAEFIGKKKPNIHDLAHTLLSRRSLLRYSASFSAKTADEIIQKLSSKSFEVQMRGQRSITNVVFVFTGQGAQWAGMGINLLAQLPVFANVIEECDQALANLPDRPDWSIADEIMKVDTNSNVSQAHISQPLCTALQLGLVEVWQSWGLKPNSVIGHSSGEIAAAYAAGFLSLRDAIVIAYYRGACLAPLVSASIKSEPKGAMCAVGLSEVDAISLIAKYSRGVDLAAVNSPKSCTLSGDREKIEEIVTSCEENGIFCRKLKINLAYHSYHMLAVAKQYEEALQNASISPLDSSQNCPMFSSVTKEMLRAENCTAEYWKDNMVSTVEFSSALAECMKSSSEDTAILELGPHPALHGPIKEILKDLEKEDIKIFSSCLRGKDDMDSILKSAGAMIVSRVALDARAINAVIDDTNQLASGNVLTDLPTYTWDHSTPIWHESRISRNIRFRKFPHHELLGSRYLEDIPSSPSWRKMLMLKELMWLQEYQDTQNEGSIPSSVFILMALEAARQLSHSTEAVHGHIEITDMNFEKDLDFGLFRTPETVVELHFNAHMVSDSAYTFNISSFPTDESGTGTRHCFGKLIWSSEELQQPELGNVDIAHDPILLDRAKGIYPDMTYNMIDLTFGFSSCAAEFAAPLEGPELCIDPITLNTILNVTKSLVLNEILPCSTKLSYISSLKIPYTPPTSRAGRFVVQSNSQNSSKHTSDIEIFMDEYTMFVSGVELATMGALTSSLVLGSVYFQERNIPDITVGSLPGTSFQDCVDMVTHKWPMADVGLCHLNASEFDETMKLLLRHNRRAFRSIQAVGCGNETYDNLHIVDKLSTTIQLHLLVADRVPDISKISEALHVGGILCLKSNTLDPANSKSFARIGGITRFESSRAECTLWRKLGYANCIPSQKPTKLFASLEDGSQYLEQPVDEIDLEPECVTAFCEAQNQPYDAVIIESKDKSIIGTWPGNKFIPWMQHLLKFTERIIWATTKHLGDPFSSLAGTLLRTLQAEQPSLKVIWLTFDNSESEDVIREMIASARFGSLMDSNEIHYDMRNSKSYITRYLPDDELSALNGVSIPCRTIASIIGKDYDIGMETGQAPSILVSNHDNSTDLHANDDILIDVVASVVDEADVKMFSGTATSLPGGFFAGYVLSSSNELSRSGSPVVGWSTEQGKSNRLSVSSIQTYKCNNGNDLPASAAHFAAMCVSLAVVDGHARARIGDTFQLHVSGLLKEAIERYVLDCGASVVESEYAKAANFVVASDISKGLTVNGNYVDVEKYLTSDHGIYITGRVWKEHPVFESPLSLYHLPDLKHSFQGQFETTYSSVIIHESIEDVEESIAVYKKPRMMFSDGAYIIIGGLGGLGRFVCSWMVENGARNLFVISRNGLNSDEAQKTFDRINASDAMMEVIKADACDKTAISEALSRIRQRFAIKGILNMAVLLGDAPMASMSGSDWDLALQLKIKSSWILHEETLHDELEFFILFSSIASVLGNRNQAGYNVGNSFLNALTKYRRSHGLTGVSIGLGAMIDTGILHNLRQGPGLLETLTRSGLSHLAKHHLAKIMEAAVTESHNPASTRSFILTGLDMFERVNDRLVGAKDQTMLYWTELPEFGFLQSYKTTWDVDDGHENEMTLKEKVATLDENRIRETVMDAFLSFLAGLLGFQTQIFDRQSPLVVYGLDSLSAVSCQYWFHRELDAAVKVSEILGAASFLGLVGLVCERIKPPEGEIMTVNGA